MFFLISTDTFDLSSGLSLDLISVCTRLLSCDLILLIGALNDYKQKIFKATADIIKEKSETDGNDASRGEDGKTDTKKEQLNADTINGGIVQGINNLITLPQLIYCEVKKFVSRHPVVIEWCKVICLLLCLFLITCGSYMIGVKHQNQRYLAQQRFIRYAPEPAFVGSYSSRQGWLE